MDSGEYLWAATYILGGNYSNGWQNLHISIFEDTSGWCIMGLEKFQKTKMHET